MNDMTVCKASAINSKVIIAMFSILLLNLAMIGFALTTCR